MTAAGCPADTCLESQVLGRQTICLKEKSLGTQPPTCPPEAVSPQSLLLPRKQWELGHGGRALSPGHRLVAWATTHQAGEERNWPWCQAPHQAPHPTWHFRARRTWQNPIITWIHLTTFKRLHVAVFLTELWVPRGRDYASCTSALLCVVTGTSQCTWKVFSGFTKWRKTKIRDNG